MKMHACTAQALLAIVMGFALGGTSAAPISRSGFEDALFVRPAGYDEALKNPLMGFTTSGVQTGSNAHEWATTAHIYFGWCELECTESDGLDRIIAASNNHRKSS